MLRVDQQRPPYSPNTGCKFTAHVEGFRSCKEPCTLWYLSLRSGAQALARQPAAQCAATPHDRDRMTPPCRQAGTSSTAHQPAHQQVTIHPSIHTINARPSPSRATSYYSTHVVIADGWIGVAVKAVCTGSSRPFMPRCVCFMKISAQRAASLARGTRRARHLKMTSRHAQKDFPQPNQRPAKCHNSGSQWRPGATSCDVWES